MRLVDLRIDGFGKLAGRTIAFDPRMTIVYGPNEAGKSTVTAALVASLYGLVRGDREYWRPWNAARYAITLRYVLDDGSEFEVQRDLSKDPKGTRVFDRSGADVSAEVSVGKLVSPGAVHLGIPLEVFENAACVRQTEVAIDGSRAEKISTSLAQALDGGPKEDAALGAIARLSDAIAKHVGTKRATVNAPLRKLNESIDERVARAGAIRDQLAELAATRALMDEATRERDQLSSLLAENDRRARSLRAQLLSTRIDALREIRSDLAAFQAERARYDDVADFRGDLMPELERRYRAWLSASTQADAADAESARMTITPNELSELSEHASAGGKLDDDAFAALERTSLEAEAARERAAVAGAKALTARRVGDAGGTTIGAAFAAGAMLLVAAAIVAIVQYQMVALAIAVVGVVLIAYAVARDRGRRNARREADGLTRDADAAIRAEHEIAAGIAAELASVGAPSIAELSLRRARTRELAERKRQTDLARERALLERSKANAAAAAFDEIAHLVGPPFPSRDDAYEAAKRREARRTTRDGIDMQLKMLEMRRAENIGTDTEVDLEAELERLVGDGVSTAPKPAESLRTVESERAALQRRYQAARDAAIDAAAQIRATEATLGDVTEIDEEVAVMRREATVLERFEAAVTLARKTIDDRTREAHQAFALRLQDYASGTIESVSGGRYREVRVDPTTLTIRVRAPETNAFVELSQLSAGTREQMYLVVRLAMARMFSEGAESLPLLFDDPFAYWDAERIERGLPLLRSAAAEAQTIVFTTSRELADAAPRYGAALVDLSSDAVLGNGVRALDRDEDLTLLVEP